MKRARLALVLFITVLFIAAASSVFVCKASELLEQKAQSLCYDADAHEFSNLRCSWEKERKIISAIVGRRLTSSVDEAMLFLETAIDTDDDIAEVVDMLIFAIREMKEPAQISWDKLF